MDQSNPKIINPQIIDASLVHSLLLEQHPDLAVRFPRRSLTAPLIGHEQRWLPEIAPRLPLPVPTPVRIGRAGSGFPWAWSVVPWFSGQTALDVTGTDLQRLVAPLGRFLRALHQPAPAGAPHNPWRSIPLDARTERLHEHLDQLRDSVNRERVLAVWDRLVVTPRWPGPPMWIHGDLHPGNVLVNGGEITAVLDFGDIAAGDPATDLSVMWSPYSWPSPLALGRWPEAFPVTAYTRSDPTSIRPAHAGSVCSSRIPGSGTSDRSQRL